MLQNSHFALATHVLIAMTLHEGEPVTSTKLAASVNTNPAFLRALLGRLKRAGLIETALGKGGGSTLARPARKITLLDVYRATVDPVAPLHCSRPDAKCVVGRNILPVLRDVAADLESAIEKRLKKLSIAALAASVLGRG